jgi:predicted SAM-dependent methyltransferase
MRYLNLGCGSRFHPGWINLDAVPSSPAVLAHDLRLGIPFPDRSFELVYHSHVLEHFSKEKAPAFIKDCYRVLQPGGVLRIAVPDLERIVRGYLQALENALEGQSEWQHHYEWMMLELYDQTVRERSGGAMLEYFKQKLIPNEAFVISRLGGEARRIIQTVQSASRAPANPPSQGARWLARIRNAPDKLREVLIRMLMGEEDWSILRVARFRSRGEIHQWMYDRYSLARLLQQTGFSEPKVLGPGESQVPGWAAFNLDTEPDGTSYKPDSLYMEAFKP